MEILKEGTSSFYDISSEICPDYLFRIRLVSYKEFVLVFKELKGSGNFSVGAVDPSYVFHNSAIAFLDKDSAEEFAKTYCETSNKADEYRITKAKNKYSQKYYKVSTKFGDAYASETYVSYIGLDESLNEANNNIKLHVEFYPYERYGGGGGKKKANVSAPDMLTALKKLVDKMRLYIDSEEIEDEEYTPEEVIEQIQMSNGDGCDYITLLQEMNSGDILIQEDYDEEEDWDDMDESLKEETGAVKCEQGDKEVSPWAKLKGLLDEPEEESLEEAEGAVKGAQGISDTEALQDAVELALRSLGTSMKKASALRNSLIKEYQNNVNDNSKLNRIADVASILAKAIQVAIDKIDGNKLGESLTEDIKNLEKVDADTVMNITMGTAKEESKTLWQRLEDAEKLPEDAPLFGAKEQPVPDEVEEVKPLKLDESLFREAAGDVESELYDLFDENDFDIEHPDVQKYIRAAAEYIEMAREAEPGYSVLEWWQDTMDNYPEDLKELPTKVFESCDEEKLDEGMSKAYFVQLAKKAIDAIDEFQDAFSGMPEMNILDEHDIMALDAAVEVLAQVEGRVEDPIDEKLCEEEEIIGDDDVEVTDEMIEEILDEVKGVFTEAEFTPEEVIDKVFNCIDDEECKYKLASEVVEEVKEESEELEEELVYGEATLDDYLEVLKRYFKGRRAEDVIDAIFKMFPDNESAFDLASSLGEVVEDYLDECVLAENFI